MCDVDVDASLRGRERVATNLAVDQNNKALGISALWDPMSRNEETSSLHRFESVDGIVSTMRRRVGKAID